MREAILVIILFIMFGFGYILMYKLDCFIIDNYKSIEIGNEKTEPSCIMLTDNLSDEEIIKEIQKFRTKYKNIKILIYDDVDTTN